LTTKENHILFRVTSKMTYERPDEWLGGSNHAPTKRWTPPKTTQVSPRREHLHNDWIGGGLNERSPGSPTMRDRPVPKTVEGMKSIKENPFFKNFGGL
jgi:hypothetical protein